MLATFYIFFEILALASFVVFFYRKDIFWGSSSLILSGMLAVAGYAVRIPEYVFDTTTSSYYVVQQVHRMPYLSAFNIGLFSISMMYLIYIIIMTYRNPGEEPQIGPEVK